MHINPDVKIDNTVIEKLYKEAVNIENLAILSPLETEVGKINNLNNTNKIIDAEYVRGFVMLINNENCKTSNYFDENFFMYLENNDLCKRVVNEGGNIFIIQSTKINHEGSKGVDSKYKDEVELSRNWHWIWSKFYFNKKNFGFFRAIGECLLTYFSSLLKILFYSVINNNFKKRINFCRASGFYNALLGKTSWYRPNLED